MNTDVVLKLGIVPEPQPPVVIEDELNKLIELSIVNQTLIFKVDTYSYLSESSGLANPIEEWIVLNVNVLYTHTQRASVLHLWITINPYYIASN